MHVLGASVFVAWFVHTQYELYTLYFHLLRGEAPISALLAHSDFLRADIGASPASRCVFSGPTYVLRVA